MSYLDTSLLVAALTREERTEEMQHWLVQQPPEELVVSDWTITEFSAALAMKVRMRQLDETTRADVLNVFTAIIAESMTVLSVTRADFSTAAHLANQYGLGLRAGDALHLGIASRTGQPVISLDRTLVKAALAIGVAARLL